MARAHLMKWGFTRRPQGQPQQGLIDGSGSLSLQWGPARTEFSCPPPPGDMVALAKPVFAGRMVLFL